MAHDADGEDDEDDDELDEAPPLAADLQSLGARVAEAAERSEERLDNDAPATVDELRKDLALANELAAAITSRAEQLDAISAHFMVDVGEWLLDLAYELGDQGLVDEATSVCDRYAALDISPGEMMAQRAFVFARAGRKDEALAQVEKNLVEHARDVDVLSRTADTLLVLGDEPRAESMLRQLIALADEEDPFHAIQARDDLADLLRQRGQEAEAERLGEEARLLMLQLGADEDDEQV